MRIIIKLLRDRIYLEMFIRKIYFSRIQLQFIQITALLVIHYNHNVIRINKEL